MATIRAYTTIEQSCKLAEILPLESADMYWSRCTITDFGDGVLKVSYAVEPCNISQFRNTREDVPCWSLAALLSVLPPYLYEWEKGIDFNLYPSVAKKRWWCAGYISQDLSPENKDKFTLITHADNPVDACVAMIEKLHELNLL